MKGISGLKLKENSGDGGREEMGKIGCGRWRQVFIRCSEEVTLQDVQCLKGYLRGEATIDHITVSMCLFRIVNTSDRKYLIGHVMNG